MTTDQLKPVQKTVLTTDHHSITVYFFVQACVSRICTLLNFCLNATYVAYKGVFYKQTQGTAMGSPVSVNVADLVMEDVEQQALSAFPNPPWFWKRYVDDTCVVLQSDKVEAFHLHLNSIQPTIQFTIELETDGCLPFLDTQITRHQDGSLSTKVYWKKTHTDKYLDFRSHHPLAHKFAVVRTLFHQADSLCSSVLDQDDEKKHVVRALKRNGYPHRVMSHSETRSNRQTQSDMVHPMPQ